MSIPTKVLIGALIVIGTSAIVIARLNASTEVTCRNIPVTREW